jgi:hypothetical protein
VARLPVLPEIGAMSGRETLLHGLGTVAPASTYADAARSASFTGQGSTEAKGVQHERRS